MQLLCVVFQFLLCGLIVKMVYCRKKLNMDEIHDIHGLRIIVETEEDCYKALRVVQQLWQEIPGRSKDYIVHPKINGYAKARLEMSSCLLYCALISKKSFAGTNLYIQ